MSLKTEKLRINGVEYELSGSGSDTDIDVVDNLETADSTSALSANQGKILNDKINNINTMKEFNIALTANGWVGDEAPYSQTVIIEEASEYNNCNIEISTEATANQTNAAALAEIDDIYYDENNKSLIFIANGIKPEVDLPIILVTSSSMNVVEVPYYLDDITGVVDDHKVDPEAHSDIRQLIVQLQDGLENAGTGNVSEHNVDVTAHDDIRELINELTTRLNALADSDDETLDQLSEIVAYIKSNKTLIESVTTSKVNVDDIIDSLISTATDKPLSANQGKILNEKINGTIEVLEAHVDNKENPHGVTKEQLGLENVDNTADINKPVSTAQQDAINLAVTNAKSYTDTEIEKLVDTTYNDIRTNLTQLQTDLNNVNVSGKISEHNANTTAHNDIRQLITQLQTGLNNINVSGQISQHNSSTTAHNDIRQLISGLDIRLNALADSDDSTLDQLSEIVAYIKSNKSLIESVTTSKVNVSDIIDNLTSTVTNKPLSANQGKVLNDKINSISEVKEINGTLTASAWVGSKAPYTQTVTISELSKYNNCSFSLSSTATQAQIDAAILAEIDDISYNNNVVTFTINGVKPTINIPFTVCTAYSMNVVETPNYVGQDIPVNHSSVNTTYGIGSDTMFGHVKLSDNYTTNSGAASTGIAASSKAVNDVYNKLYSPVTTFTPENSTPTEAVRCYYNIVGNQITIFFSIITDKSINTQSHIVIVSDFERTFGRKLARVAWNTCYKLDETSAGLVNLCILHAKCVNNTFVIENFTDEVLSPGIKVYGQIVAVLE